MLRALIFIAVLIFFRAFVMRPRNSVLCSPYRNTLDGHLTAEQLSALVDEIEHLNSESFGSRGVPR